MATRPLYQMLETVRAYAALELTAAGERDDALEGWRAMRRRSFPRRRRAGRTCDRSNGWIACVKISRATAAP